MQGNPTVRNDKQVRGCEDRYRFAWNKLFQKFLSNMILMIECGNIL